MHRSYLIRLLVEAFMAALKKEVLVENWDYDLHTQICTSCLKQSKSFPNWLNKIQHTNIILCGTDYHFSNDTLRLQLDSLLNTDLQMRCKN